MLILIKLSQLIFYAILSESINYGSVMIAVINKHCVFFPWHCTSVISSYPNCAKACLTIKCLSLKVTNMDGFRGAHHQYAGTYINPLSRHSI